MRIIAFAVVALALSQLSSLSAQDPAEIASVPSAKALTPELWGGLYSGMTPVESQEVIEAIPGVKRAKYETRQDGYSVLDVNVDSSFKIAGKKAKIELVFWNDKLLDVEFLFIDRREWGQCYIRGAKAYNFFNEALSSKYTLIDGVSTVDDDLLNLLTLQSRAAAFKPYGDDPVDDVRAVFTDGGDLLVLSTLVTTGQKESAGMLNCEGHDFLDGHLRLVYTSKSARFAIQQEVQRERDAAARSVADDL